MFWCQWYLSKLYFYLYSLAEEQNKWKMFSHTPLGPKPKGLFWVMFCQLLFCCLPLLTEISEQESFFEVYHLYRLLFFCAVPWVLRRLGQSLSLGEFLFFMTVVKPFSSIGKKFCKKSVCCRVFWTLNFLFICFCYGYILEMMWVTFSSQTWQNYARYCLQAPSKDWKGWATIKSKTVNYINLLQTWFKTLPEISHMKWW